MLLPSHRNAHPIEAVALLSPHKDVHLKGLLLTVPCYGIVLLTHRAWGLAAILSIQGFISGAQRIIATSWASSAPWDPVALHCSEISTLHLSDSLCLALLT